MTSTSPSIYPTIRYDDAPADCLQRRPSPALWRGLHSAKIKVRKVAAAIYRSLTSFDYRTRESYWQHLGAIASGRKE